MAFAPTTAGFAYFAAVKLVGYSLAGAYVRRQFGTTRPHPIVFGVARTLVGVGAGIGTALLYSSIAGDRTVLFYVILAPIRFLEWYLLLTLFFGRPQATGDIDVNSTLRFNVEAVARQEHFVGFSMRGILWSYALDLPAVLSLIAVPGGAWIC